MACSVLCTRPQHQGILSSAFSSLAKPRCCFALTGLQWPSQTPSGWHDLAGSWPCLAAPALSKPGCVQANIIPGKPADTWPLQKLAAKLKEYCKLAEWSAEDLQPYCQDYATLQQHLRQRGADAYWQRVRAPASSRSPAVKWELCRHHWQRPLDTGKGKSAPSAASSQ